MKGIILCGGKATRLYPVTISLPKALVGVYDKPLIYYSLTTLVEAGIDDILIIVPPGKTEWFRSSLGDGSQWGIRLQYMEQLVARGIADAFIIGEEIIGSEPVCLILGDNIFYHPIWRIFLLRRKPSLTAQSSSYPRCRPEDVRRYRI
jgi:glucose-1-phosphate thymidylyltransferase